MLVVDRRARAKLGISNVVSCLYPDDLAPSVL
jgi:hypothetical protein